ncbi:MAG: ferredoxin oxidoreductase, partial [Nitrospinaceae bacterium]|nr:ferredoxin oxidoreductase [Nitrospinaceae bacterium]NIR57573.1 ferredoxin oxidoreductase [Nitrospinaceae bacterium]NIS88043.1 ferredoxin oxidoreductase [Nitrospinaceae bacterium]NIT84907.1 ferredoxin oxidoreductase [Nitrospinaceae bacterium]NIU47083.1 ferredoxin oxidoreductase [Nitrospinaceae bacterium]
MGDVKRYNIRMAGIGGQGVVTASHILSNGVVISGGFSSLVPFFGSEKRNAPVESYVRISNQTIYEIGEIIYPNVLMIFHPAVITLGKSYTMPFYMGLKQDGIILINNRNPIRLSRDEERELEEKNAKTYYVPCTELANEIAKTDLATNMAMCGAISAIFGMPDIQSLAASVKDRFIGKGIVVSGGTAALDSAIEKKFAKKQKLLEANMKTLEASYQFVI